jgi:hypothetical protein
VYSRHVASGRARLLSATTAQPGTACSLPRLRGRGGEGAARGRQIKMPRANRPGAEGIGGVSARDADRHGKIPLGDGTVPDFVTAPALPDENAIGRA